MNTDEHRLTRQRRRRGLATHRLALRLILSIIVFALSVFICVHLWLILYLPGSFTNQWIPCPLLVYVRKYTSPFSSSPNDITGRFGSRMGRLAMTRRLPSS